MTEVYVLRFIYVNRTNIFSDVEVYSTLDNAKRKMQEHYKMRCACKTKDNVSCMTDRYFIVTHGREYVACNLSVEIIDEPLFSL